MVLVIMAWAVTPVCADENRAPMPSGVPASIEDTERPPTEAFIWSGQTPTNSEALRLTAASGTVNGETVVFGCVRDHEGIGMAFIDSTDDRPLVAVLWYPLAGLSSGMASLWSDGMCQFIEVRQGNVQDFGDRVLWLSSAIPNAPRDFLGVSESSTNPFLLQATKEFLRFSNSVQLESEEATRWVPREVTELPEFLDERIGTIESRFFEMRDRMEGVTVFSPSQ